MSDIGIADGFRKGDSEMSFEFSCEFPMNRCRAIPADSGVVDDDDAAKSSDRAAASC